MFTNISDDYFIHYTNELVWLRGAPGQALCTHLSAFRRSSETSLTALQRPITGIPSTLHPQHLPRSSNHPKNDSYGPLNEYPTMAISATLTFVLETTGISIVRQHFSLTSNEYPLLHSPRRLRRSCRP